MTIAGEMPFAAPTWCCQAESQSKVWKGVQSAVCSKRRQSASTAAKLSCTEMLSCAGSAPAISAPGAGSAASRASTMISAACATICPDWVSQAPVSPISLNKALWPARNPSPAQMLGGKRKSVLPQTATAKNLAGLAPTGLRLGVSRRGVRMKLSLVVGVSLALAAFVPAHGAPLDGAYRAGNYPRTIKRIAPAAERGNPRAQAFLGFMYQYGRGVPQNYALATYWYRRAAEQGNPTGP